MLFMKPSDNWVHNLIDSQKRLIESAESLARSRDMLAEDRRTLLEEVARGQGILQDIEKRGRPTPADTDFVTEWEDRVYQLSRLSLDLISRHPGMSRSS